MQGVLIVLIALQFLAYTFMLLVARDGAIQWFNVSYSIAGWPMRSRVELLALCALTSALMARGVYCLYRLFGNYSRGEVFTRESVGELRQLGITGLLWGGVNALWTFLPRVFDAHGPRSYALNTDFLTISSILLIVAWFMEMAVEIREENELTI